MESSSNSSNNSGSFSCVSLEASSVPRWFGFYCCRRSPRGPAADNLRGPPSVPEIPWRLLGSSQPRRNVSGSSSSSSDNGNDSDSNSNSSRSLCVDPSRPRLLPAAAAARGAAPGRGPQAVAGGAPEGPLPAGEEKVVVGRPRRSVRGPPQEQQQPHQEPPAAAARGYLSRRLRRTSAEQLKSKGSSDKQRGPPKPTDKAVGAAGAPGPEKRAAGKIRKETKVRLTYLL